MSSGTVLTREGRPVGPFVGVAPWTPGDVAGQREAAVAAAQAELATLPPEAIFRRLINEVQAHGANTPPVDFPLQHTFAPGIYLRTIILPAGSWIVGKIHRHAHGNVLSKGRVRMATEAGGIEELKGPLTMLSEPGTKRLVLALTEAVWTTVHPNPTNTRDLAQLEREIIAPTYADYEQQQHIEVTP